MISIVTNVICMFCRESFLVLHIWMQTYLFLGRGSHKWRQTPANLKWFSHLYLCLLSSLQTPIELALSRDNDEVVNVIEEYEKVSGYGDIKDIILNFETLSYQYFSKFISIIFSHFQSFHYHSLFTIFCRWWMLKILDLNR